MFIRKVQSDEELQARIKSLVLSSHRSIQKGILALGTESGFHFTLEDLQQFAREAAAALYQDGELDEAQLEAVAGGNTEAWAALSVLFVGVGCLVTVIFKCDPHLTNA